MMGDLALVLVGGFLGSSHCIGMCGGFALSIGIGSPSLGRNVVRQLLYSAGRIFTYGILGSFAGFAGLWFAKRSGPLIHAQAILSVAAGLLLMYQGLKTLKLLPASSSAKSVARPGLPCQANSFLGPLLTSPQNSSMLIAGILNGFLPCGLVYGYLALASSRVSFSGGLVTMVAFGLGTVPLMVLTGAGATFLGHVARRRLFQVAGVCVLITGMMAVNRGFVFWGNGDQPQCPACDPEGASTLLPIHTLTH